MEKYQGRLDPRRLVFIDETRAKANMTPIRGWAPRGHKLVDLVVPPAQVGEPVSQPPALAVEEGLLSQQQDGEALAEGRLSLEWPERAQRLERGAELLREPRPRSGAQLLSKPSATLRR